MSDVSKTNDLIAELKDLNAITEYTDDWLSDLVGRAADALEAATRVPVQGEPNDDRVAFFERARMGANHLDNIGQTVLCEWSDGGKFTTADIRELERIASRATVPDAATEELRADKMTAEEAIESVLKRPGMYGLVDKEGHRCMKAERDAALAAVGRVRAVVKSIRFLAALPPFDEGNTVMNAAADDIVAALDGAPEPEWEYGFHFLDDDGNIYKTRGGWDTPEKAQALGDEWIVDERESHMLNDQPDIHVALVRRRKSGPWLPVEGESK